MPNRLIDESSPYLLQHANNPVDWHPWGPEALELARSEDRPIFLSIGYSACHWCHVMERESFESESIAELMNRYFINIKVDREERPDLDRIYMQAVQLLTGHGGWPMSVWLTPDLEPFYGGTYFPPEPRQGMPSFPQLVKTLGEAWKERRDDVLGSAGELAQALRGLSRVPDSPGGLSEAVLRRAVSELSERFDSRNGGFGRAPKFPGSFSLAFLLRAWKRFGNREPLSMTELTLRKMARGGIYDQLGGGFHRYSVDARWLVPHFEKMLYDNALLSNLYIEGWQATGQEEFARVARETLDYVLREMTDPSGGFYSTQDADSEGEEGKFFVWTPDQVEEILGEDARAFCFYYDVTPGGNFEHSTSILNVNYDLDVAAYKLEMETAALEELLARGRSKLFQAREERVKPGRDEKVLAAWNGIMLVSMAHGFGAFGKPEYLDAARANAEFMLTALRRPDGRLYHSWKDGKPAGFGFSDDYAGLIAGLLSLFGVDFDGRWLGAARELTDLVLERFWDEDDRALFFSDPEVEDLLTRPKEFEDGATPSGNNLFLCSLIQLSRLTGESRYRELAEQGVERLASLAGRHPSGFGVLLAAADLLLGPNQEIVLAGESPELLRTAYSTFAPGRLVVSTGAAGVDSELVEGRNPVDGRPAAYLCEGHTCRLPVTTSEELHELLTR